MRLRLDGKLRRSQHFGGAMPIRFCLLCLLATLLCGAGARAQQATGSISGTAKDPSGAVVPNAKVTLTDTDKGISVRTATTGSNGEFSFPQLPVSHYSLAVEAPNFRKFVQTGIVLNVQDKL